MLMFQKLCWLLKTEQVRAKKKYFLVKPLYSWNLFLWFWALLLLFRERRWSQELLWWERKIIVIPEECSSCHITTKKQKYRIFRKHCLQWEPYTKVKNWEVLSVFIFFHRYIIRCVLKLWKARVHFQDVEKQLIKKKFGHKYFWWLVNGYIIENVKYWISIKQAYKKSAVVISVLIKK